MKDIVDRCNTKHHGVDMRPGFADSEKRVEKRRKKSLARLRYGGRGR